jgi:predicted lipoprotein with Yx(FWY)xxD motif
VRTELAAGEGAGDDIRDLGTFGTITQSGGATQATFDGHPLYTFAGDTAPGQAKGNGLTAFGGS